MGYVIGVDIGGTFTDCVALAPGGRLAQAKALSTHRSDPGDGVLAGVGLLADELGLTLEGLLRETDRVCHGTTIGTNLAVERKGGPVGLITTFGHGDALSMMRGHGRVAGRSFEEIFDVGRTTKPDPIVPRPLVAEVHERIDADGDVAVPLDEEGVAAAVRRLVEEQGAAALAVCTLWSFLNPVHERRIAEIARQVAPGVYLSLSSQVSPRLGEYERSVATVINAYIGPASSRYLQRTAQRLKEQGLAAPFLVMQASGGVIPVDVAERLPVTTLGSGPAGGLAGTAALARYAGHTHVIATDMGGTSFDVGLIVDGEPVVSELCTLGQYEYLAPHLDVRSIACGGGSVAWADPVSGALRIGPHSAGSRPGPAAYGLGGTEPTVTDADVVLGLLSADGFLDGKMRLEAGAAREAVMRIARPLGLSAEQAAAGMLRVNNNAAANLIRQRTIEQGLDPRDFVLYAYGGAGPVHAFGFAEELGVRQVIVPLGNGASTLSAYGAASCDVVRYFDRPVRLRMPFSLAELAGTLAELEASALEQVAADGDGENLILERFGLMRYAEQYLQSLPLRLPSGQVDDTWNKSLQRLFESEYSRLYGPGALVALQTVEIFGLRVRVTQPLRRDSHRAAARRAAPGPRGARPVFWPGLMRWEATEVWAGADLAEDDVIGGPAVIELPHTTVAVAPGQRARLDSHASLVLTLGQAPGPARREGQS